MEMYTVLIICEGEKTEPLFFQSISDELMDGKHNNDIRKVILRIAPEPVSEDKISFDVKVKHKAKRPKRITNCIDSIDNNNEEIKILEGKPPLRWILTAKEQLKSGAYDEVWAVFDNDNHPAKKEAFLEAKKKVGNKKVNIAYSSLSFEYYLLVHFERIYKRFNKTDCKLDSNTFIRCGTNLFPDEDCKGDVCINGYAQIKNYWNNTKEENTKNSLSTYLSIKSRLSIGFINSEWIRYKSTIFQKNLPIYDKNPYLSIDRLVKKLIDDENNYIWLNRISQYQTRHISICIDIDTVTIKNIHNTSIILPKASICLIENNTRTSLNQKEIIAVNHQIAIDISTFKFSNCWFMIKYENDVVMFENEY